MHLNFVPFLIQKMKAKEEDDRQKVTQLIDITQFGIKAKEQEVKEPTVRWVLEGTSSFRQDNHISDYENIDLRPALHEYIPVALRC